MSIEIINENTTAIYTATLVDENENPITFEELDYLKLTLCNKSDKSIINNRYEQDVLNNNDVTIDNNGLVTWNITKEDTIIVNDRISRGGKETHIAKFEWGWLTTKAGSHELVMDILKLIEPEGTE